MQLYAIRHARTSSNERQIINGQYDDEISAGGRQEIPLLVEKLRPHKFDTIYSSPLRRAMGTALPIAEEHNVDINVDRRIIEVNMGSFSNKPYDSMVPIFGKTSSELLDTYEYDLRKYGGESAEEVRARVNSFMGELKTANYAAVLVVTHGGIIRWLHYLINGRKTGKVPNLSIHKFLL